VYKNLIRPLLFLIPPEAAHYFTCSMLKMMRQTPGISHLFNKLYDYQHPSLEKEVFGLRFKNPVGLAAGFDKNALMVDELAALGFGFVEIGTLTPLPQEGNPQPRLFRLPADKSLINRMGFNNEGVKAAVQRLRTRKSTVLIGGNIGKNKLTPNEQAIQDYEICYDTLYDVVDYFVVNISSPNTPGLRELQEKEPLKNLLTALKIKNQARPKPKPLLLKIAPDLSAHQLDDIVEICMDLKIDGIIATNTTISREGLQTNKKIIEKYGAGGLSGKAVKKRSTEVIRYLHQKTNGKIPIIGVGGIASPKDALEKLEAGASLVQLYTGFIYEGPALIREINKTLVQNSVHSSTAINPQLSGQ
jgi:dihydroorotate dehydrogenase